MKTNLTSNLEVSSLKRRWKHKEHIFVLIEEMKTTPTLHLERK
jgi:hypothetical protein